MYGKQDLTLYMYTPQSICINKHKYKYIDGKINVGVKYKAEILDR